MQTRSVRVLGLCGLHMFHWWWVSQQSGTEGCDVVPKLGYTWAVALSLATSQLREFSFRRAISMCKNTTQSLCNSHSPANLDFSHTSCNFQIKSHVDLHRPAGDTLLGERVWAWVPGKIGGFVFGYLVICVIFLLFLNIVK